MVYSVRLIVSQKKKIEGKQAKFDIPRSNI
jgi:hypothetical protein